jgi:methionine-rich copper-binding protein CopC
MIQRHPAPWRGLVKAGLAIAGLNLVPASAEIIFAEHFESPEVSGFAANTVPDNGMWVGSAQGYGSDRRGLYNEAVVWPDTPLFETPYGEQGYKLDYTNSGLTTAQGVLSEAVTEGVTYQVSFNVATEEGAGAASYLVELVAFEAGDDNTSRKECRSNRPGTVLTTASGSVSTTDMSESVTFTYTPAAGDPSLGKEIGLRLINAPGPETYDNLRFLKGHDMNPSPPSGITTLGGDLTLGWTNYAPNTGTDVWVDVWYGTDPEALTKIVDAGLNADSATVNVPSAGTYYWRVDSYLDGSSTGTPLTGDLFYFVVDDTDGDGFTDEYELANTDPPSNTALNPDDDLDGDGLTNMEEFNLNTDPNLADTDGDTLDDGAEVAGAGARPATSPLAVDTDGDGLDDAVESNTGIWVGASDTGTDPTDVDWDRDGLTDGLETNTGVYVDRFDTGTDPYSNDSDGDGVWDWYESEAALTNPNDASDSPSVPYPLPDPDGSQGNTSPVKVYILSGQSNMVGIGDVNDLGEPGALSTSTMIENKWPNFIDELDNWTSRDDVWYKGVVTATADKALSIGCGSGSARIGPELGFGHIVGWHHDEPVILLKASQGNRSLAWDFLPPGSQRYTIDGTTYAGYGDSQPSWPATEDPPPPPEPGAWYAGKQYDDCVAEAQAVLANFDTEFPQWSGQGYEIAGFVWWQGHKDGGEDGTGTAGVYATRYEENLVNLIQSFRSEFNASGAPFVVGTVGFGGGGYDPGSSADTIFDAQLAVGDPTLHPEFAGTVKSVDTTPFWRPLSESPGNQSFHYNNNGETYTLVGDAFGRAMLELDQPLDYLVATSPADDETDARSGADLVLTFAEDQVAGSGNLTLKNLTDGIDTVIPVTDPRVAISGNQVTIEASDLIDWETDFAVRIDAGFVETTGGTPYAGIADDTTWNFTTGPDLLTIAASELTDHINGVITLTAQQIADHKAYFDANRDQFDRSAQTITDLFTLVETFDAVHGPLWIATGSFNRDTQPDDLEWTIYHVMQYLMDEVYTPENLALYEATLESFKFGSSDKFPGACDPPADPGNVHTVTVNASYPDTAGWERQGDGLPARRATGTYVAPGTVVTVTVPTALVGQGLEVRVGAHSWDMEARGRTSVRRLDRASLLYDLDATTVKVASPYGGGIYIEVPLGVDFGPQDIDITGAVRSPLFSLTSYDQTTVQEWQDTERHHPAPWADFRTDGYMVQVPTAWIYNTMDPTPAMQDWQAAVDTYNDLMGFPRVRGKETIYNQVDVINRSSVYAPGYPAVNVSTTTPTADNFGGDRNHFFVRGPRNGTPYYEFHEHGHAYRFQKFGGESESTVNLPHAAIMNQCFGVDIDTAHAGSLGFAGNPYRTANNTAVAWMLTFNFSPREVEMASGEKAYQLKGHAKFIDVARMFGWDKVNAFWQAYVDEYEATGVKPSPNDDTMTVDLSKAVGKDMRPLLHFWGIFPDDPVAVENAITAENLPASPEVYELLNYYKSLVPANNAEFQQWCLDWWDRQPDPDNNWTEWEHARQWDSTDVAPSHPDERPNGEIFDEAASAEDQARVQAIIDLYFANGNPDPGYSSPPSPDPMSFATAPYGVDPETITMTAYPATDIQGPVEYYIENVTTGEFRGWSTDQDWTQTGLSFGTSYDYRVKARDALGNETAWSAIATASPLADEDAPSLVALDPADDSNNVDVFVDFTLNFDEDVAVGTGDIVIRNLTDGIDTPIAVTDGAQVSVAGTAVVIDPAGDLEAGKAYAIQVPAGAVTDVWGNAFAGITDNTSWSFATALTPQETILLTENFESPDVAAYSEGTLPDNANWVGSSQGYGSGRRGITDKAGGDFAAADPNFQAFAFRYTNSGLTSAEGVIGALESDMNYEVTAEVVRDDGKNTGTPYTIELVAFDAGDDRSDCRSGRPGTVLATASGDAPADGGFATATLQFTASAGDPSLGKDLGVRFLGASTSAIIDNVAVKTVNTGGADGVPPALASLSPADESTAVAIDSSLAATFSEDIAAGTGLVTIKNLTAASQTTIDITDGGQVSVSAGVLTITPAAGLAYGSDHAIRVDAGAIVDLAGNPWGGIADDTTWNFTTGAEPDATSPTLASADIVDDQAGGPVIENTLVTYTLTFSEDIDETTVDASDFGNAGTSSVTIGVVTETSPGVFSVEATPAIDGTLQFAVLAGAAISDVAGNPLDTATAIADDTILTVNPPATTVPDVVGLPQSTAESEILAANLVVGTVTEEYSATVPAGDVISQGLGAGSSVPEGSAVDLVVSLGLDPSPKLVRTTVSSVGNTSWTTVDLGKTYNSPVIIATPIYPTASLPPVVTRITNVTSTGFDLKIDRADGLTDPVSIDVSIVAVDEGVYTQAVDGVTMEAVKFTSTVTAGKSNWVAESRAFQNGYTSPVVIGQVMSANDPDWSVFWSMGGSRTKPVDASNLNVGKHVGEDPDGTRADEMIGYLVIEAGSGTLDGVGYEAALGADSVQGFDDSSSPYTYSLSGGLSSAGSAAVGIAGMDGPDGAWAVLSGDPALTATSLGLHACEDVLGDTEQKHNTEEVGYIVFE